MTFSLVTGVGGFAALYKYNNREGHSPQRGLLWVLLLAAVYVLCCDYRGFSKAFRAPIAVFLTAGSMLVLWAALKRRAVEVWAPFLLLGALGAAAVPPAKFNYAYLWPIGKPVTVAALGESLRADRMSINGYVRDTTPWLRQCPDVVNFPYCVSAAFSTCDAQPVILTNARRCLVGGERDMQPTTGSVFELFAKHGFPVYSFFWARRSLEVRFHKVVEMLARISVDKFYADGLPLSSLPKMKHVLESNPGQNLLLYINNEGSHVPFQFFDRETAPFAPWAKDFSSPAAQAQEVNNAYDATVHYTDKFFREVAEMLKGRPFVYFYVSDHGEVLGDGGKWGRGAFGEDNALYHKSPACMVGMFVICSPEFCRLHPHFAEAVRQLRAHANLVVGHEHVFHTLLGLIGIRTPYYDATLDLCSPEVRPYAGPRPANCPPAEAENARDVGKS